MNCMVLDSNSVITNVLFGNETVIVDSYHLLKKIAVKTAQIGCQQGLFTGSKHCPKSIKRCRL